jgi:hypothetical protein
MGDSGILWPTWIIAGASVVNVLVLLGYAISTRGIRRETQRSALNTEKLAMRSWETLKLQVVLSLVELRQRIRWTPDLTRAVGGDAERAVTILTDPLLAVFTDESQRAELRGLIGSVFGVEPRA